MAMRKRKRELIAQYEEECSLSATQEVAKRRKTEDDIPQPEERAAFAALLEEEYIRSFLARDSCLKISDKYLLAMVVTYFRRARLRSSEYGTFFFPALFLANQFEEDVPYQKEIYRWALGWTWSMKKDQLLQIRNDLLTRMGFRAWVDRATCDLIMAQDPDHWHGRETGISITAGQSVGSGGTMLYPALSATSFHARRRTV
ncbi:speedy protein 1-A-like [Ranitomeya variabilis]|uniref:speedy protein 1-A-like n=1 Tax=Ranitomeya variabilis TaxID=490064 RepID=UPI00405669A8